MVENGIFKGQLKFWNLFLFGFSKADMIRQNILFFDLEVDFLVVKGVQIEHLIELGLFLGDVEAVHEIWVNEWNLL